MLDVRCSFTSDYGEYLSLSIRCGDTIVSEREWANGILVQVSVPGGCAYHLKVYNYTATKYPQAQYSITLRHPP
jgi:hypothetical protein